MIQKKGKKIFQHEVLLIVDCNDSSKDSVLKTKSVVFNDTGIITRNYLDDFPFPLFALIQKIDSLPDVISEILKQWMEMWKQEIA